MRDQYRRLSDREIREEGITLIKNAIKAQHLAEPLIMSYLDNKRNVSDKNWGCYMVQQSIELSIKGIIKYYYSDFIEGHFLKDNAEILDDLSNMDALQSLTEEEYNKVTHHLNLELLDIDRFVKVNKLQPISNPVMYTKDNIPSDDGLLSNKIFGVTVDDRSGIFAYIDF